jgi:hypothetical protein
VLARRTSTDGVEVDHYEPGVALVVVHLAELRRQADRQRLAGRSPGRAAGRRVVALLAG